MRERRIRPTITPARIAWLRKLRDEGPAVRAKSVVGYECMKLGWTDWLVRDRETGAVLTLAEARAATPPGTLYMERYDRAESREAITAAGRAVLAAYEARTP